jgi:peptide/nickel transport system substrate-binding protein
MDSHYLVRRTPTLRVYSRNPYYFKVDPAGHQLPYIDTFDAYSVVNKEVIAAKTSTGQFHFSAYALETSDIPLFKMGEKTGRVKVYIWKRLMGTDVVLQPNLTHSDPVKRKVFNDLRFRKALSHAINRGEINKIIYFGKATPRQTTVIPTSRFYESEFATAFTEYRPDHARQLLDDMGMKDIDGDGLRESPEGKPFSITLEWIDTETPKALTLELVSEYWREIGIDFQHRQIDSSLQNSRASAGVMDMTLWHADRTTDVLMPQQPFWFVPMHVGWEECHWNEWTRYYLTDGKQGEKPPIEIAQLHEWWDAMRSTMDEVKQIKYGKKILCSNARNLWTIGTVGLAPMPVVIRPGMRNVPTMGYWGWDSRFSATLHPETWYFEQRQR